MVAPSPGGGQGWRPAGLAILLIDKHVTALSRIADRHDIIAKGQVVWSGTSAALRADALLRQRYLSL